MEVGVVQPRPEYFTYFSSTALMLDDSRTFPILSSAFALLFGLLWVFGIFGRIWSPKPADQVSELDQRGCPPTEFTTAADNEVWEVPRNIGELTVTKLLVHPIKVSL